MTFKYIIVKNQFDMEDVILFGKLMDHHAVTGKKAISAGFVEFIPNASGEIDVSTYGESTTLKLKPRPIDAKLIKTQGEFRL